MTVTIRRRRNEACPVCGSDERLSYQETVFETRGGRDRACVVWYCDACNTPYEEDYALECVRYEQGGCEEL